MLGNFYVFRRLLIFFKIKISYKFIPEQSVSNSLDPDFVGAYSGPKLFAVDSLNTLENYPLNMWRFVD